MTRTEDYEGHSWIKVRTFAFDPAVGYEANYRALLEHHQRETSFLIAEVRRLAGEVDELRAELERASRVEPAGE